MKIYEWVLFDADDTLFRFDAFNGLQLMFASFGIDFTSQDYLTYQSLNKSLWIEYQTGNITADQVKQQRFEPWAAKAKLTAWDLNTFFIEKMAEICTLLDGAMTLLDSLKGRCKLGIITNGFTQLQQVRLERTGVKNYFDCLVISEQVGYAKPHIAIFEHALASMGNPLKHSVLMVGDTLETDILGGIKAGIDTCWLNVDNKEPNPAIKPHYQVSSLADLGDLLSTPS